jgi:ATP-dependent protease ClpP protease subunit
MLKADAKTGKIRIDGEIGSYFENGVGSSEFSDMLDAMAGNPLDITIKSDGGDVFEGLSIYNQLKQYPGKVSMTVDALAASIASVIVMAADDLAIHKGSMLMIHNPWTVAAGDAAEFRGVADVLDLIGEQIAGIYAGKSGGNAAEFLEIMTKDTYIAADDAKQMRLVDRIIGEDVEPKPNQTPIAAAAGFANRANAVKRLKIKTLAN